MIGWFSFRLISCLLIYKMFILALILEWRHHACHQWWCHDVLPPRTPWNDQYVVKCNKIYDSRFSNLHHRWMEGRGWIWEFNGTFALADKVASKIYLLFDLLSVSLLCRKMRKLILKWIYKDPWIFKQILVQSMLYRWDLILIQILKT